MNIIIDINKSVIDIFSKLFLFKIKNIEIESIIILKNNLSLDLIQG